MPILQLNTEDGILSEDEIEKVPALFEHYPINQVGMMTDLRNGFAERKQYVFIGYDPNEKSAESSVKLTTSEFVN